MVYAQTRISPKKKETNKILWDSKLNVSPIVLPVVCCFIFWRLGRPRWGHTDGAEDIFGFCRTRVGCGLASGPTLKRPCAILVRWWDGEQIKY